MSQATQIIPQEPVVYTRGGEVFANSFDIAGYFRKEHRTIVQAAERLLASDSGCAAYLRAASIDIVMPNGGVRKIAGFEMTQIGFTLVGMGLTGSEAVSFKLRYIAEFERMRDALRAPPAVADLSDPSVLRGLLLGYTEKVVALEEKVEAMQPQVDALERIAISDGSLCITDAAKTLQVQPKSLFSFLRAHRWIYMRAGTSHNVAYQDKLAMGLLEHKVTTIERSDGSEKTVTQVRVTPKGLARLGREFPPVVRLVA